MTDRYDEMRVAPDPSQAEALRRRLHARLATTSRDDGDGQSRRHSGALLDSQHDLGSLKEIHVTEDSPTHEGRNRRILGVAAAVVIAVIGVAGIAVAMNLGDDDTQSSAASPVTDELPEQAPVEITACVKPGPEVHAPTEELSHVSVPEGDMTITRERGVTWRLEVSDVSDPRLDGTWYLSENSDWYSVGGQPGPGFSAWTHRIETDEGAWQGSFVFIEEIPGVDGMQFVFVGEGPYEGLTAAMYVLPDDACPNTVGYVIEGTFPAPPVPQTGQ